MRRRIHVITRHQRERFDGNSSNVWRRGSVIAGAWMGFSGLGLGEFFAFDGCRVFGRPLERGIVIVALWSGSGS
jgi:hypothetical protein